MNLQYYESYEDKSTHEIVDKLINIKDGLYELETHENKKWIWTEPEFGGRIKNIKNITFTFTTQIDNELYIGNKQYEIKSKTLTTINFSVENKDKFVVKIKFPYIPSELGESGDTRELGIYLISIKADGIDLF